VLSSSSHGSSHTPIGDRRQVRHIPQLRGTPASRIDHQSGLLSDARAACPSSLGSAALPALGSNARMGTAHRSAARKESRRRCAGAQDRAYPLCPLARWLEISGVAGSSSGAKGDHPAALPGSSRAAAPPPANHLARLSELKSSVMHQGIARKCTTLRRGVQRGLTADIRVSSATWCVEPHRDFDNPIAASLTDSQTCAGPPISSFRRPAIMSANSRLRPPRVRRLYLHAESRVEERRGGCRIGDSCSPAAFAECRCLNPIHGSVSAPRSSNRTCGFPASGSPTGFHAKAHAGAPMCSVRSC
jgi:hypothetical protein